jgi:hypothetical protein
MPEQRSSKLFGIWFWHCETLHKNDLGRKPVIRGCAA